MAPINFSIFLFSLLLGPMIQQSAAQNGMVGTPQCFPVSQEDHAVSASQIPTVLNDACSVFQIEAALGPYSSSKKQRWSVP